MLAIWIASLHNLYSQLRHKPEKKNDEDETAQNDPDDTYGSCTEEHTHHSHQQNKNYTTSNFIKLKKGKICITFFEA
jgi:hypothetical protein